MRAKSVYEEGSAPVLCYPSSPVLTVCSRGPECVICLFRRRREIREVGDINKEGRGITDKLAEESCNHLKPRQLGHAIPIRGGLTPMGAHA